MTNLQACPTRDQLERVSQGCFDANTDAVLDHVERCDRCANVFESFPEAPDQWAKNIAAVTQEGSDSNFRTTPTSELIETRSFLVPKALVQKREEALSPPCDLKHYKVLRRIGRGGMGEVYEGWDTLLQRRVAIKVQCLVTDQEGVKRFREELSTNGQLSHPNLVNTYAGEQFEGRLYLIQEYLDGANLRTLARHGQIKGLGEAIDVVLGICHGLQELHTRGYVHCDLKPANVMRLADGSIKLIDYGLTIPQEQDADRTRLLAGTIGFMSPEQQTSDSAVDHRADLFALGQTIFYILERMHARSDCHDEADLISECKILARTLTERLPSDRPEHVAAVISELSRLRNKTFTRELATRLEVEAYEATTSTPKPSQPPEGQRSRSLFSRLTVGRYARIPWQVVVVLLGFTGFEFFQFVFESERPATIVVANHRPGDVIVLTNINGRVHTVELGVDPAFKVKPGQYAVALRGETGRTLKPESLTLSDAETVTVRLSAR